MSSRPLRVLQVIDSLEPGGSEKMAVLIANALSTKIELSALVCTRQSGKLKDEISDNVLFSALHKKSKYDIKAFLKLRTFLKTNRINIIHAHSTSFFWGTLLKLSIPGIKLLWHDHYGFRAKTPKNKNIALHVISNIFDAIITVNKALEKWAIEHLKTKHVQYLPNFVQVTDYDNSLLSQKLKGKADSFKIIHVANLRKDKDHLNALKAVDILVKRNSRISYHALGKLDSKSEYYRTLNRFIKKNQLHNHVFFYGSISEIPPYLSQADLGILSSVSEGLPVSLLEYINAELPVVVTDVGQCREIVENYGKVVSSKNDVQLATAIAKTIKNIDLARENAKVLKQLTTEKYDTDKIINQLIEIYRISLQS